MTVDAQTAFPSARANFGAGLAPVKGRCALTPLTAAAPRAGHAP